MQYDKTIFLSYNAALVFAFCTMEYADIYIILLNIQY